MAEDFIKMAPEALERLLKETFPGDPLFPELEQARGNRTALRGTPQAEQILQATEALMAGIEAIPPLTYTMYRAYQRTGYWQNYGQPFYLRRSLLTAAALRLYLGDERQLDTVHDYIWAICEESTWVIPYHERHEVDLFASETAAMFAQLIVALGDVLAEEVCQRMRAEVERRVFEPYLARHARHFWYKGGNNWNGVCNGSVGSAFLMLESDSVRLARALALVLESLDVFLQKAFEADGSSTEGVGYWQYGLSHFVEFAELLRHRTRGQIDLLVRRELAAIAGYPAQMLLSAGHFANYSDCEEGARFGPGLISRLAERTGVQDLVGVLARPGDADTQGASLPPSLVRWFDLALRSLHWWDGRWPEVPELRDVHLPGLGYVRLVARTRDGVPVVLAFKAGHNAENHNHNDVGSLILHVDGETYLCDPGRGLYDATYFGKGRYRNLFARSLGHSLPRVGGCEQSAGREFAGTILGFEPDARPKSATADLAGAYDVPTLSSLRRTLTLAAEGEEAGTLWVHDRATFEALGAELESAFVTWLDVEVEGGVAVLHGQRHDLRLAIEAPQGAVFSVQDYAHECQANQRDGVLRRLSLAGRAGQVVEVRVRAEVL